MLLRLSTQALDNSLDLAKVEQDFLNGVNWDITNGNNNALITGLVDPTSPHDVANKEYVDNLVDGLQWKHSIRALATSDVTLSGTQTVDGVSCVAGDLVGCFNQTTTTEDGVYVVQSGAWVRAEGWAVGEGAANFSFLVEEGTANADSQWTVTNNSGSDVIGTDDLILAQTGGPGNIVAGNGLTLTGNTLDVVAADLSLTVGADDIAVNIGNTNGDSLEVSATGLELKSTITGDRLFTGGTFYVGTTTKITLDTGGPLDFVDYGIQMASNHNPIPFSKTTTIDHGSGTSDGAIIDDFRAAFIDEAIINAIMENHDAIAGFSISVEELTVADNASVTLTGGTTTSEIKRVYQNGNKLISTEFTVADDGAHRTITEAGDADFTNGDVIEVEYIA